MLHLLHLCLLFFPSFFSPFSFFCSFRLPPKFSFCKWGGERGEREGGSREESAAEAFRSFSLVFLPLFLLLLPLLRWFACVCVFVCVGASSSLSLSHSRPLMGTLRGVAKCAECVYIAVATFSLLFFAIVSVPKQQKQQHKG